ncbi:hypothetical protein V2J09_010618 [Rumex salicifolius]
MDDDGDYQDYDESYNSAGDDFGEVYGYDDDIYGGDDDEGHDPELAEGDQELEEEEFADDQMADYEEIVEEEEQEENPVYDDQLEEEEEIVEDQDGAEFEGEMVDFYGEEEEVVLVEEEEEEEEVFYGDGAGYWDGDTPLYNPFEDLYEDDPFDVPWLDSAEPCSPTRPRHIYFVSESSDSGGDERRSDGSESESSAEWHRRAKKVKSGRAKSGGSNESSWKGFHGPICPICFRRWTEEGQHCVCCLPCGHIYGMSCIKTWLERPNSQKCPQCNETCELVDVKRLYGLQLATPKFEELQQKVECLEAKCADLETKDADWLRKEAEWQKREADLQQQLIQHKQGLVAMKLLLEL